MTEYRDQLFTAAQEAFGYEGIDPLPSLMAQRDPVIEKVDGMSMSAVCRLPYYSFNFCQQDDKECEPKTETEMSVYPYRAFKRFVSGQKYVFNCETETDDRGEHLCQ